MKETVKNAASTIASQAANVASQTNDILTVLEKVEDRKRKLESEIEISTSEDDKSKKRTIVSKLDQKIVDLHESL